MKKISEIIDLFLDIITPQHKDGFFITALIIAITVLAVQLYFSGETITDDKRKIIILAGMSAALVVVGMARFLSSSPSRSELLYRNFYLGEVQELRKIKKSLENIGGEGQDKIIEAIHEKIEKKSSEEFIEELRKSIKGNDFRESLKQSRQATLERIYSEIYALGRRGTVNLILGVLTALVGIITLTFFVLTNDNHQQSLGEFAISYLPRLSIVVIIEVFSYFFLRLYKSSLSEIKYFQNEATNIEYNFVALEAAIEYGEKTFIEVCLNKFISIERNPVFLDGQETRELKEAKLEADSLRFSPEYLVKVIEAVKKE
ncbi:hypothetical protein [Pseudomonas sp. JZ134]|uniref:hypothetical protein n=1 Tax=Pseudomonas sp. JZ134 TaxID=2806615 RepID=UPI003DA00178